MKQALLEYLIRECASEILTQVTEAENHLPEPPKDDGEEEIPPVMFDDEDEAGDEQSPVMPGDDAEEEPKGQTPSDSQNAPEGDSKKPEAPSNNTDASNLKGVVLVNPRDKSKLQQVPLKGNDAQIERDLHRVASALGGSKIKTALSAMRAVKDAVKNPNETVYVYLGKYDPESEELFIMADKSLQVAKDQSVGPEDIHTGASAMGTSDFDPMSADSNEFATRMASPGQTPRKQGLDESLRQLVKKMVIQTLSR